MKRTIKKLLIANRGEIAVRVMRTANRLGISTVAVFSDADADARHVRFADQAVALKGNTPLETYLSIEKILDACRKTGADAVHPGYGFLSENAAFAKACEQNEITFIGPGVEAIDAMGNKSRSKELMIEAGVPTIPGYQGTDQSLEFLIKKGKEIGFPIMIKAAAGGGGRGLRFANDENSLRDLLIAARTEAERAFADGELLLERALTGARHVEVQVFGDRHGNVIHLGERDCSVQRRHQKVLEESPCPQVTEELRKAMGESAVRAARSVNYVGAGTVEFLLDSDNKFYFLEMNTRLQVEHPVTEMVTGLDLVEWQLLVASGAPLPLRQEDVQWKGHSIEARLYAEDPNNDFLPQVGDIHRFQQPCDELARTDHGLNPEDKVSPYYDAMLAKVITYGDTRDSARQKLVRALNQLEIFGIKTNRRFLVHCLEQDGFASGAFDTSFIQKTWVKPDQHHKLEQNLIALSAAALVFKDSSNNDLFGWSSNADMNSTMRLEFKDHNEVDARIRFLSNKELAIEARGETGKVRLQSLEANSICCTIDGVLHRAAIVFHKDELHISWNGNNYVVEDIFFKPPVPADTVSDGNILAPSNGLIGSIEVQIGQFVEKGATIFTVDAMKLLQSVCAPVSGIVVSVLAEAGQQIKARQLIVQIEPEERSVGDKATREISLASIRK